MNRKPDPLTVLFLILSTVMLLTLAGSAFFTFREISKADQYLDGYIAVASRHTETLDTLKKDLSTAVNEKSAQVQAAEAAQQAEKAPERDRSPFYEAQEPAGPSVFDQIPEEDSDIFSDSPDAGPGETETVSVFSQVPDNGHVVGIDPGHQGEWVDMSDLEPNGPGSTVMKVRCTSGTEGNITHIPEYQLNLDISLRLKEILESRGYRVVMTRETNDANISNMERAQYVTNQGAEIFVRIHANSVDNTSANGALTMAPSQSNPYVSHLSSASWRLASLILDNYCNATGLYNQGVQNSDDMTGINWSGVPVTILEMGYMSNPSDEQIITNPSFYDTMANGIADGIDAYFR